MLKGELLGSLAGLKKRLRNLVKQLNLIRKINMLITLKVILLGIWEPQKRLSNATVQSKNYWKYVIRSEMTLEC